MVCENKIIFHEDAMVNIRITGKTFNKLKERMRDGEDMDETISRVLVVGGERIILARYD